MLSINTFGFNLESSFSSTRTTTCLVVSHHDLTKNPHTLSEPSSAFECDSVRFLDSPQVFCVSAVTRGVKLKVTLKYIENDDFYKKSLYETTWFIGITWWSWGIWSKVCQNIVGSMYIIRRNLWSAISNQFVENPFRIFPPKPMKPILWKIRHLPSLEFNQQKRPSNWSHGREANITLPELACQTFCFN